METLVESALRSTLLAAGVAVLLRGLRIVSPRVVHRAWAGVALVMLSLPAIVTWAPEAAIPVSQEEIPFVASRTELDRVVPGGIAPSAPVTAVQPGRQLLDWRLVVVLLYLSGAALFLVRLRLGFREARALVREAEIVNGRLTHPRCITPVTVGLFSPVVILPAGWPGWTDAELAAVLAHEEEHVRRRDPLAAFVTLLNRAVFWFHPLAWWLQRKVSILSEQACDEAVISQGHDVNAYAASLLKFARSIAGNGTRVAMVGTSMPGTGLRSRLLTLARPPVPPVSARRLACIAAAYVGAVVICSAATPTTLPEPSSQSAPRQALANEWLRHTAEHYEIFYERREENRLEDVRRQAEDAYAQVSSRLKYQLAERVPLILVRRDSDISDGVLQATELVRRSGAPSLHHIVISTESLDTQAGILVHELTHQFSFEILPRASQASVWLIEGLAEYHRGIWNAGDYRQLREDVAAGWIPDFDTMTSTDRRWGHALFDFIAAEHGDEGVRRLLFALRSRPQVNAAIAAAFAMSPGDFSRAFRAYVTTRFAER